MINEEKVVKISGQRIKALREEAGLLQQDLAPKILTDASSLSLYENGKRNVPKKVEDAAAKFFNVSVDYIRGRTDNKNLIVIEQDYSVEFREFYKKLTALGLVEENGDIDSETLNHIFKVIEANKDFIKKNK